MDPHVLLEALPEILTQLLGFLIVFWILKRYAFGPILGVIEKRQKTIEEAFADIQAQKRSLEGLERDYKSRLERIEEEARLKIQEAAKAGAGLSKDIQEKAKSDAQKLVERAKAEIAEDIQKAKITMRDEIVSISSLMAEKIIKEKLNPKDHERLVHQFLEELEKK